jgi:iron complex outermembrane receptor protein
MKENRLSKLCAFRWKQFNHKAYSVFSSLRKEVNIGVLAVATLTFANVDSASAQSETPKQLQSYELEEVEVTGTRVPLTEAAAARMVTVLSHAQIQAAAVHSINDLLEYAVGVDVRQRGEFGIQTDISIRGGTFDQITLLLNGVNISNPQTGHLAADFPVSIDDIERVEILEGPAARVFGTSAFTGAINIVTRAEKEQQATVQLNGGGYGLLGGGAQLNLSSKGFSHFVTGNYNRSDGATENSDFKASRAFYRGGYAAAGTSINWQLGASDQRYGANTFYSALYPDQYEETQRLFAAIQAETQGWLRFRPTLYWNRSYDHFQLIRDSGTGENFHRVDVYGANLNAYFNSLLGKTAFGAELRNEGILSTNLGRPLEESQQVDVPGEEGIRYNKRDNRTNVSYYLEHNVITSQVTLSLGLLANMNTALDDRYRLYPGIDLSYRPSQAWKLFASWNSALRMPTFTDFFYKSPVQEGNVGLKPEKTQAVSLGAQYRSPSLTAKASAFYHAGKDMIDWVIYANSSDGVYHAANFKLDNAGIETEAAWSFDERSWLRTLRVGYTYIHQRRHDDTPIEKSNYALEYLRHKFVARLDHRLWQSLSASWAFRWQDRMGGYLLYDAAHQSTGRTVPYASYALLDLKLTWQQPTYRLYAEASNLLNRTYYDYGNIPQPGCWLKAGVSYRINWK